MLPPAIIQRELGEHSLHLLRVNANFPNLPLVGSFRTGALLAENVARLAQRTASEFALNMGPDIAIPPAAAMTAPAWGSNES